MPSAADESDPFGFVADSEITDGVIQYSLHIIFKEVVVCLLFSHKSLFLLFSTNDSLISTVMEDNREVVTEGREGPWMGDGVTKAILHRHHEIGRGIVGDLEKMAFRTEVIFQFLNISTFFRK